MNLEQILNTGFIVVLNSPLVEPCRLCGGCLVANVGLLILLFMSTIVVLLLVLTIRTMFTSSRFVTSLDRESRSRAAAGGRVLVRHRALLVLIATHAVDALRDESESRASRSAYASRESQRKAARRAAALRAPGRRSGRRRRAAARPSSASDESAAGTPNMPARTRGTSAGPERGEGRPRRDETKAARSSARC